MKRPAAILSGLASAGLLLLAGLSLSGAVSFVTTHGISMEPRFHTGDLAIVRRTGDVGVGDVVAYHSQLLRTVVLHRIVRLDGNRFVLKGDHNTWLDSEHPSQAQIVGQLAWRIPAGGRFFAWLTQPRALGVAAFVLLTGGAASHRRRRRHGTLRRAAQGQDSPVKPDRPEDVPPTASTVRGWTALPQPLQAVAAAGAVAVAAAVVLGAVAWTRPVDGLGTVAATSSRQLTFSYTARMRPSAAYPSTTVSSPDPVFRTLADTVDVRLDYQGPPGVITVAAQLSTSAGWRGQVALGDPVAFTTPSLTRTVRLDLTALDTRVHQAAAAIQMPAGDVGLGVVATVHGTAAAEFSPRLDLKLTPQLLQLAGDAGSLTVKDHSSVQRSVRVVHTLSLLGPTLSVAAARRLSAGLLLAALLAGAIVLLGARHAPAGEAAAIRRRYASLLVEVHPRATPPGWSVVDVTGFAALAKLADRYDGLVLHWSDHEAETFVVQDDGTIYRYRSAPAADPAASGDRDDSTAPGEAPTGTGTC